MKGHMADIAIAKIGCGVLGPLVRLCQEHPVLEPAVDMSSELLQESIGFREILTIGPFTFEQVGHGIQSKAIDAHPQPKIKGAENGFPDREVVKVKVGLMGVETMPVVCPCNRVPCPVGNLKILK